MYLASDHGHHEPAPYVPTIEPSILDIFFWGALPYVAMFVFIGGTIWRYRVDQFGWTTRSSQIYESKILKWASPAFHYGMVGVFGGHVVGLLVPKFLTDFVITDHFYHIMALSAGSVAACAVLAGLVALVWRRLKVPNVWAATTQNDKFMYIVLIFVLLAGTAATVLSAVAPSEFHSTGEEFNYRESISIWFRSLFYFHPEVKYMVEVPLSFKIHIVSALCLFIIWPFTRLVHALSLPLHYLFRPYTVYRSRRGERVNTRRGWDQVWVNKSLIGDDNDQTIHKHKSFS